MRTQGVLGCRRPVVSSQCRVARAHFPGSHVQARRAERASEPGRRSVVDRTSHRSRAPSSVGAFIARRGATSPALLGCRSLRRLQRTLAGGSRCGAGTGGASPEPTWAFRLPAHIAEVAEAERVTLAVRPVRRRWPLLTAFAERGSGPRVAQHPPAEFPHGAQARAVPLPPFPRKAATSNPTKLGATQQVESSPSLSRSRSACESGWSVSS